jgi:SAM-dependent methyltransferase
VTLPTPGVHGPIGAPSAWVMRVAAQWPAGATVVDVACGHGRHARVLAAAGHRVTGVDRDAAALAALAAAAPDVETVVHDLEGVGWPFGARTFDVVVVTNYLHRALFASLLGAVAPGGWYVHETFAAGNERFGRPSSPDFLLRPGELLDVVRGTLRVLAFEDVEVHEPKPACVQRIVARRI